MTYGIAIAIVVIAVAALYSMGVFRGSTTSSPPCSNCFSEFAEINFNPHPGYLELEVKNGPADLNTMTCTSTVANCAVLNSTGGAINAVNANSVFRLTFNGTSTDGTSVTLSYQKSGSSLPTTRTQVFSKDYFQ